MDTRIKPYAERQSEEVHRVRQLHDYRRNQIFGVLLIAVAVCAWWLCHANPKWIFTAGWWRP